jgi:hypothetical protein
MEYKEGSMGLAILVGLLMFFGINIVLGLVFYSGLLGMYAALMPVIGTGFLALFMGYVSIVNLLIDILVPIMVGIVAGALAKGSAGRGFVAGLSSSIIGYFIGILMAFLAAMVMVSSLTSSYGSYGGYGVSYSSSNLALGAASAIAPPVAQMPTSNLLGAGLLVLALTLLVVPIVLGVVSGIGGAMMSALIAKPFAPSIQQPSSSVTTVIQAPLPYAPPPMVFQQGGQAAAPAAGPKVLCPACKTENESASTFCQSCGTRLRS